MELLCCIALFVVSLVTATPYGYGTKGGAVAKADASAASGTFSGPAPLPFSIPTGSGFSGSYSKSSSSSFASSSASSSSSSSSFSFSGTGGGLNTFKTNNDGAIGGTGCSSGSCQSSGGHSIAGSTDSGSVGNLQGYTGHNAADATSGSIATGGAFIGGNIGSQVPCSGSECQNQATGCEGATCNNIEVNNKCTSGKCNHETEAPITNKCASGKCEPDLPGIPLSGYNSNTECDSGDCTSKTNTGSLAATYNPNDIPVKVSNNADINLKQDAKHQTKNNEQVSIVNNDSGCTHENCGSPTLSNIIPTTELSVSNSYQNPATQQPSHSSSCNTPDCISGNINLAASHNGFLTGLNKPTTDLSPPNIGIGCTTNCHSDYSVAGSKISSLSNNLHVTRPIEIPIKSQCSNGDCGSPVVPGTSGPSTSDCTSGNCGGLLSNQAIPYSTYPSKTSFNVSPNTGCNTPNCASGVGTSGNYDIHQGLIFSDSGSTHSFKKLPSVTSPGLSSHKHPTPSSGCKTPNCFPQFSSNPPGHISPHQSSPNLGCNAPNCAPGLPNFNVNLNNQGQPGHLFTDNNPPVAPNKKPGYTYPGLAPTALGTISGCTTPNCAPKPASDLPVYNKPHSAIPLSCNTPDCYINQLHPTGESQSNIPIPAGGYTPTGSVPNHVITGPSLPNVSNGIYPSDCKTSNCAGNISPTDSLKDKLPPYKGGFGGPTGILKPNEFSPPSVVFPSTTSNLGHPDKNLPTYSGGFGGPTGLLQPVGSVSAPATTLPKHPSATASIGSQNVIFGHYAPAPGTPSSGGISLDSGSNTNLNQIHPSKPTHGKLPSHVEGFGASTGLLKPNEFGTEPTSADSKKTVHSGTTAYDSQTLLQFGTNIANTADTSKSAVASTNQVFGKFDVDTPMQIGVGTVKPTSPKDQDNKKLPPYTGGFHAPAGLLKPNDYNSPSSGNLNKLTVNTLNQPCSLGNCDAQPNPSTSTTTQGQTDTSKNTQVEALAGSQADAVTYTGGFRGPPGFLKPYDDGKLESSILGGKVSLSSDTKDSTVHKTGTKDDQDHSKVTSGSLSAVSGQVAAGGIHLGSTNQANVGAQAGAAAGVVSSGSSSYGKYSGLQAGIGKDVKLDGGCGEGCGTSDTLGGSYNTASAASQANAVAQASAGAVAFSSGYGGIGIQNSQAGSGTNFKTSGGCDGGCDGSSYTGSSNLGYHGAGYSTGLSAANTKSVGGARGFGGFGGSYASSSASSHASAGFPTKGGYGKR
ncbi:hypothetical protein K1T71_001896 [Dendrolimus kikuchii]|uniref:Uncharacterized protein n=1 Tax=Dendrolimus kikuchii TaxID=765133 RepID=A0ACC1DGI3_9NEOP|nr:hypothetical protein K1T71_001896 [Dendrolimus kikuchii]